MDAYDENNEYYCFYCNHCGTEVAGWGDHEFTADNFCACPSEDEKPVDTSTPPAPCGYCRRCALHDDPGGCLTVEAWERDNPVQAIAAIIASEWMAPEAKAHRINELIGSVSDPFVRAEAVDHVDPVFS